MNKKEEEGGYKPKTFRELYDEMDHTEYTVGDETRLVHSGDTAIVFLKWAGIRTDWVEKVNNDGTLQLLNTDKPTLPLGTKVKIHCPHGPRGL